MTVAEYIFDFLVKKGCKTTYMVSGSSAMWLTDALCRNEKMQAICCHHEQAAAMAADGYGRVNGIPGACLVTIGPGATNAITGVAQAWLDSSPMFIISGQANSRLLQYQIDTGIRQCGTQSLSLGPIVESITKYFSIIMKPEETRFHLERAYYEAVNGRKGPVWIDVPVDIQNMIVPDEMIGFDDYEPDIEPLEDSISYVIDTLSKSHKPLVLVGNGVCSSESDTLLLEICTTLGIPIVTSRGGIGVIESDNPLFVGRPGCYGDRPSHFAIQQCDALLVLGSRLSISTIGYYPEQFAPNATKIMVDIDIKELERKDVPIDFKIRTDVFKFLTYLKKRIGEINTNTTGWRKHCLHLKEKYPNVLKEYKHETPLNEYYFTQILSNNASNNANIIVDTGSVCNVVSQSWNIKKGQKYLISGGLSCMGFWATAIGTVQSGRQVIAITGDGSAQMNIQELATIKYNNLPIKLFIYNNNGYMLIRHNQHNYMEDRFLGVGPDSGLQTPDFVAVARAYGIEAIKIEASGDEESQIRYALNYDGPIVCEIIVQEFAPIIPRIASKVMPDGSLKAAEYDDLFPFLQEVERLENKNI